MADQFDRLGENIPREENWNHFGKNVEDGEEEFRRCENEDEKARVDKRNVVSVGEEGGGSILLPPPPLLSSCHPTILRPSPLFTVKSRWAPIPGREPQKAPVVLTPPPPPPTAVWLHHPHDPRRTLPSFAKMTPPPRPFSSTFNNALNGSGSGKVEGFQDRRRNYWAICTGWAKGGELGRNGQRQEPSPSRRLWPGLNNTA